MKNQFEQLIKKENTEEDIHMKEAREIFGKDYLGPEAIKEAFGIELKEIPEIPFSKKDLERAKELNQQLVLYVDQAPDGKPFTGEKLLELTDNKTSDGKKIFHDTDEYENEKFFTKEIPNAGWKLVFNEVIPDSTNKDYLKQTEVIIDYLKNQVFIGNPLPNEYQKAIKEFESKKHELEKILASDWKKAAEILENLQITKLTRETPIETLYRLVLNERKNNDHLLEDNYAWTSRRSSNGELVYVGRFYAHSRIDANGVRVHNSRPTGSDGLLGASFSRSF